MTMTEKKCPYCGEKINHDAIKCRFCNEWLNKKDMFPFIRKSQYMPVIVLIILIVAGLFVGGVVANGNSIGKTIGSFKSMLGGSIISPSPTPSPQVYPTNVPPVTEKPIRVDSDPIIRCTMNTECGGGYKLLRKSVCDQSTCCQVVPGGSWVFYESKAKCLQDQNAAKGQNTQNNTSGSSNRVPVVIGNRTLYCDSGAANAVKEAGTRYTSYDSTSCSNTARDSCNIQCGSDSGCWNTCFNDKFNSLCKWEADTRQANFDSLVAKHCN